MYHIFTDSQFIDRPVRKGVSDCDDCDRFVSLFTGEPRRFNQVCVGTTSEMPLRITETDIYNLVATVRSPSGQEQPSTLKRLPNGHLGKLAQCLQ